MSPKASRTLLWSVLTLWVGTLWSIGYLAVPVLFAGLPDRMLAGAIAGRMFEIVGWTGVVATALASLCLPRLLGGWRPVRTGVVLVAVMLVLDVVICWGIQPVMTELKLSVAPADIMETSLKARFAWLHGLSSIAYLLESLIGLGLVVWLSRLGNYPRELR